MNNLYRIGKGTQEGVALHRFDGANVALHRGEEPDKEADETVNPEKQGDKSATEGV